MLTQEMDVCLYTDTKVRPLWLKFTSLKAMLPPTRLWEEF